MALGHSPQIVTQGLVFYIDPSSTKSYAGFGNTIYNVVNSSIGGTFFNFSANPIDNTTNRSIYLNGSTNAVLIPSSNLQFGTSDFTIQFWVKIQGLIDQKVIFGDGWQATNGGFLFYTYKLGSNERITYYSTSTSGTWDIADAKDIIVSPSYNTWYNIAVSRIGNTFTLYSNGQSVNTFSSSLSLRNTGYPYSLGASPTAGNACTCSIGSVLIYKNKGLTATEILQNYNSTRKKYYPEEQILRDGLILNIDPGNRNSYPGTGNMIYDLSGFGNNGTLSNNPVFSSLNGGQLGYNGTSHYITFGNKFSFTSENFSFSYWVFVNTFTTNQANQGPVVFWKGNYNENGYYSQIDSNGSFGFITNSPSNQSTSSSSGVVKLKYWHHITIARNGSSVKLYCDGLDVTLSAATHQNPSASNQNFLIANYNQFILANIQTSQFLIYNRALTQQEILQNYNATKNRFVNALPPVKNNLILELDAASVSSYPGTGNTWYDLSGNSLNGALTNGPTFSGIGATSSIVFDGSNDYIDCGYNSLINSSTQFTIECWYKSSNISVEGMLFSTFINSPSSLGYHLEIFQSKLSFQVYPSGQLTQSTTTLSNNTWYQLITVYNSGAVLYFVNGQSAGTASYTFNPSSTNLLIGKWPTNQYYLNGQMAITKFYNRALSAVEIKQNFDYYRTRYGI